MRVKDQPTIFLLQQNGCSGKRAIRLIKCQPLNLAQSLGTSVSNCCIDNSMDQG